MYIPFLCILVLVLGLKHKLFWCVCVYVYAEGRKEVFLFNTLNTFYLWLYGIGHMVKDHSDSERRNPLMQLYGYSFPLAARDPTEK